MSKLKNICFFNTTPFWGGGEKWHFEATKMMAKTGLSTYFVCDKNSELSNKLNELNITQLHISVNNRSFLNPIKVKALVQFFKENAIQTVIFNSPKDLKIGGKAAKKAGVPTIVYRRGIAVEVKKSALNEKLFKNVVTHFIFNSEATKALVEKNFKTIIPNKKSIVLYNAIDFNNINHTPTNNIPIVIGNAGRLVEQKGQKFLIAIAKKLKENGAKFKLKIAGEGPLFNVLSEQIKAEKLENEIELLGFVKDMKGFMQSIDIFVSTALWEGFGFVIAEAMIQKKPVLGFHLSSNPELIEDGKNGYLIESENTSEFAKKLLFLINNYSIRKEMGEAGFSLSKAKFDQEKQFQKLVEFLSV